MSNDKTVVDLQDFATEQVKMTDMLTAELITEVVMTAAKHNPTNIVLLAINDEGAGRLYHTQPTTKFNMIGALYAILHWLTARSGLDGAGR